MRVQIRFGWIVAAAILGLSACGGAASAPSPAASSPSAASGAAAPVSSAAATGSATGSATAAKPSSAAAKPSAGAAVRLGASQNITSNAPIWLTKQAGLFEKNGLNVDLQSINATTAIKQLVAGQLEGTVAGAPESITARAAGSPIQIVAVLQTSCDMEMVVPNNITAVEQLKGKVVGVITKPSVNGICTVADLRKHGLEPDKDYKLIETGSASAYASLVAAMQAGNVAAGAIQPDLAHKLEASAPFHTLYDMGTEPGLLTAASSVTFADAFIKAHPDEVQKVVDTLLQGEAYYKQHKDEAEALLKSTYKMTDQTQIDETYARQVQLMAKDITPRAELFPDMVAALAQVQPEVKQLDLSTLLNPTFAKSAMDRGLTNF